MSESLIDRICRHEGFSSHVYLDAKGYLSIGYGTTVGKVSREIEHLLRSHPEWLQPKGVGTNKTRARTAVEDRLADIRTVLFERQDWWDHGRARRDVLVEMSYQLGVRGCINFKRMWIALHLPTPDYETAADEMLDSRWAKQTPERAEELARIMRSGT